MAAETALYSAVITDQIYYFASNHFLYWIVKDP